MQIQNYTYLQSFFIYSLLTVSIALEVSSKYRIHYKGKKQKQNTKLIISTNSTIKY